MVSAEQSMQITKCGSPIWGEAAEHSRVSWDSREGLGDPCIPGALGASSAQHQPYCGRDGTGSRGFSLPEQASLPAASELSPRNQQL